MNAICLKEKPGREKEKFLKDISPAGEKRRDTAPEREDTTGARSGFPSFSRSSFPSALR